MDKEGHGGDYDLTTFVTWKITTDKIKELNPELEALEFMTEMSYLGPDDIHREIFTNHSFMSEDQLDDYIATLANYNMIRQDTQGVLSIHRLVQQVTRLNTEPTKKDQIISKLLTQFTQILQGIQQSSKSNLVDAGIVLHAQILWKHALKHLILVEEFLQFPLTLYQILDARGLYLINLSMLESTLNV